MTNTAPSTKPIETDIDPEQTLFGAQAELEQLFDKNQLHSRIRKEFTSCSDIDFALIMETNEISVPFGFDVLVQISLHKRCNVPTMIGLMRRHTNNGQHAADLLQRCVEADLLDYNPELRQFTVVFEISDDVQLEIDKYQFPLPMVVPPRELRTNKDTGYLLSRGSVILRNNHHENDVCLDHLNTMNATKFSINLKTSEMINNSWRNLDSQKPDETKDSFDKRVKAFEKYDRTARDIMDLLCDVSDHHYITHRYDKRGRVYCMGYHVNYQGTPWNKAIVELADKELVL